MHMPHTQHQNWSPPPLCISLFFGPVSCTNIGGHVSSYHDDDEVTGLKFLKMTLHKHRKRWRGWLALEITVVIQKAALNIIVYKDNLLLLIPL